MPCLQELVLSLIDLLVNPAPYLCGQQPMLDYKASRLLCPARTANAMLAGAGAEPD